MYFFYGVNTLVQSLEEFFWRRSVAIKQYGNSSLPVVAWAVLNSISFGVLNEVSVIKNSSYVV